MTTEDKELLMRDLCARLPYGVKVSVSYGFGQPEIKKLCVVHISQLMGNSCTIKPYLRPLSNMTEEERKELIRLFGLNHAIVPGADGMSWYHFPDLGIESVEFIFGDIHKLLDWLNAHHFDYRGLIKMGLALEAPEGMYNFK